MFAPKSADISSVIKNKRMKLSDFAKEQGMAYISVYKLWQQGHINGEQLPSGTILVDGWKTTDSTQGNRAIVYARVPTDKQKIQLTLQIERVKEYAEEKGYEIVDVIEEIGFGFNPNREKFLEILQRDDWDVIVVENKEIPVKFGFDYFALALAASKRSIDYKYDLENSAEFVLNKLFVNMSTVLKPLFGISQKKAIHESIDRIAS